MTKTVLFLIAILVAASAWMLGDFAEARTYGRTVFMDDVSVGTWSAISNVSSATTTGGTYTNGTYTNYYRFSGTNIKGRLPLSTNLVVTFVGNTNSTNAVIVYWPSYGGLMQYVVERSYDAGSTWSNWTTVTPWNTNLTDYGTNAWTATLYTNLNETLVPTPTVILPADHGSLTGLSDDDHTQYTKTNQTGALDYRGAVMLIAAGIATNSPATLQQVKNSLSATETFYHWGSTKSDLAAVGLRTNWYYMTQNQASESNETTRTYTSVTNNQYLSSYVSDSGVPPLTEIQKGVYGVVAYLSKTGKEAVSVKAEAYLLASDGTTKFEIEDTASESLSVTKTRYDFDIVLSSNVAQSVSDRWMVRLKVASVGAPAPAVNIYTEAASQSYLTGTPSANVEEDDPLSLHRAGGNAMSSNLNFGAHRGINLADGIGTNEAVNMSQLSTATNDLHGIVSAEISTAVGVVNTRVDSVASDVDRAEINIAFNSFRAAQELSGSRYSMFDGFTDNFTNSMGVDMGGGSNYSYVPAGEYFTWTNHDNDISSDIVLQYGMNESALNNTVSDSSGVGNNGTYFDNGASQNTDGGSYPGVITNSLKFVYDSLEDGWYIDTGTNFVSTFRTNFSLMTWVTMTDGDRGVTQVFAGQDDSAASMAVHLSNVNSLGGASGAMKAFYKNHTGTAIAGSDNTVWANGSNDWKHIAATFDFGTAKMISLYVDGALIPNDAGSTGDLTGIYPTNYARVSTETLWLGGLRRIGKTDVYIPFGGRLDDFRIVERVLSPEFIRDYYDATSEAKRIQVGGPMAIVSTNGWYATSEPTSGRSLVGIGGDHQSDVKHWISKDDGTNWTEVTASRYGALSSSADAWGGTNSYAGSGSNMLIKVTCTNNHSEGFIYQWHNSWKD